MIKWSYYNEKYVTKSGYELLLWPKSTKNRCITDVKTEKPLFDEIFFVMLYNVI